MIKLIDFSNCDLSSRNLEYGGRAGEKKGIIYNGDFWFLKFPKNTNGMDNIGGLSYVTSPLSEFIGSNIFKILGLDVHETILGVCFDGKRYKPVCACKDFISDDKNELLIPYTSLRNDADPIVMEKRDSTRFAASNINENIFQLEHNTVLSKIAKAKERFWDVVVIDLLINNNDRNEDNWGVIKSRKENSYKLAPVYDCGNSFYSKTTEARIINILEDQNRLYSSSVNGITAYVDDFDDRISIKDVVKIDNPDLKLSIAKIRSLLTHKMLDIENFINSIPENFMGVEIMSNIRKEYYIKTIKIRIKELLN